MNVELHLHTDAYYKGIGDGAQTVTQAVDIASKRGATAIAMTDHGNCVNWTDFFNYARGGEVNHQTLEKKGLNLIKPILGIEDYERRMECLISDTVIKENNLSEEITSKVTKTLDMHMILLAKDYKGLQQIARLNSEENRIIKAKEKPVGNYELLKRIFSEPGHVVCSSACVAGIISSYLLFNNRVNKEIGKIERRIAKSEESLGDEYKLAKTNFDAAQEEIDKRTSIIDELKPVANKKYGKAKTTIKKEKDDEVRALLQAELDKEVVETENAKARIKELKEEIKNIKSSVSDDKKILTKAKSKLATIDDNNNLISYLKASLKSEDELLADAIEATKLYKDIFGSDFYIELQYHHIDVEAFVMPILVEVAKATDTECIITNDVHVDVPENLETREYLRNCAQISRPWNESIPGDEELYFKTYEEKKQILSEIISPEVIDRAIENVEKIADSCNIDKLSESNHYPEFKDADTKLRELAETGHCDVELLDGRKISISSKTAGIEARYGKNWNDSLKERFEYELGIISKMGFSSYFLFIADVIIKCKEARENATDIGPGRGSGAGSIVCYLAAITELDPIKYDLLFERFLNPERVSMPKQILGV